MLSKEKIDRINELSQKSKVSTLTEEEKREQKVLREEYISSVRKSLKNNLLSIKIVDEEGQDVTPIKLKHAKENRKKH
ncbi:DUF896 domain-containing protein [Caldalkalibacillus mannanilyticus]|uniref:DUF896 domain-containing protein n=1 Tax=Caldalkalibacillus mannanilyticus TaxID=1418 RepID=UPI000469F1A6|nr:DUF896 domain-containing protein [Caldalkalibacillus mannanilyticus]